MSIAIANNVTKNLNNLGYGFEWVLDCGRRRFLKLDNGLWAVIAFAYDVRYRLGCGGTVSSRQLACMAVANKKKWKIPGLA